MKILSRKCLKLHSYNLFFYFFLFPILLSMFGCVSIYKELSLEERKKLYRSHVKSTIANNNYLKLNKISNHYLAVDSSSYFAAYNKGFALEKIYNNGAGVNFYLNFIKKINKMPEIEKLKWIDIALANSKKTSELNLKLLKEFIFNIKKTSPLNNILNMPKILKSNDLFIYLDKFGQLFTINSNNSDLKKINFYNAVDFNIFDHSIIFVDSINLIKLDLIKNKYINITSFNSNEIRLDYSNPELETSVIKANSSTYLYSNDGEVLRNLPVNNIAISNSFDLFGIKDELNNTYSYKVFNRNGDLVKSFSDKFLAFTEKNDYITLKDGWILNSSAEDPGVSRKLFFVGSNFSYDKLICINNKVILKMPNLLVLYDIELDKISVYKADDIYFTNTGLFVCDTTNVYFISYLDISKKYTFDKNIKTNMVFSDINSSNFAILEEKDDNVELQIYDLKKFFFLR